MQRQALAIDTIRNDDPGPNVAPQILDAALLVRSTLEKVGLRSFVKSAGGVGLHLVVPIVPELDWSHCFAFSRTVAESIARQNTKLFTTAMPKQGREHKILLDYFGNNRTNPSIAAYSTRAKPVAPISVPLGRDELSPNVPSNYYTVLNYHEHLDSLNEDPWHDYWSNRKKSVLRLSRN